MAAYLLYNYVLFFTIFYQASSNQQHLQEDKITSLQEELHLIETLMFNAESINQRLKRNVKHLTQELRYKNAKDEDSWISFTTCTNEDKTHEVNESVIFNRILINGGGFYNNETGRFSCPVDGHYAFHLQVRSIDNDIITDVMLDDTQLISVASQGGNSPYHRQGSAKVNIFCTAGQIVWVKNRLDNGQIRGTDNCATSFSGRILNV